MRGLGGLLFIMLLPIAFFSPAMAKENCASLFDVDRNCESGKPLIIARGVDVKLVFSGKKNIDYPLTEELQKEFEGMAIEYCPDKKCTCEESVGYLQFGGQTRGVKIINTKEKKRAENYKCSIANGVIWRLPQFAYASANLVSVEVQNMEFGRGAGGSCHGNHDFITYDAETGNEYKLKDIVIENSFPAIGNALLADFISRYARSDTFDLEGIKKMVLEYVAADSLEHYGFVVENGKLYTNIGGFILSCADGNFFPVEVPEKFIKPEFLRKMK